MINNNNIYKIINDKKRKTIITIIAKTETKTIIKNTLWRTIKNRSRA